MRPAHMRRWSLAALRCEGFLSLLVALLLLGLAVLLLGRFAGERWADVVDGCGMYVIGVLVGAGVLG